MFMRAVVPSQIALPWDDRPAVSSRDTIAGLQLDASAVSRFDGLLHEVYPEARHVDVDRIASIGRWLQDLGDPYQLNIFDGEGQLGLDLGVYGAPETYLVDAEGVIRYRHVGVVDERVWRGVLAPLYTELGGEFDAAALAGDL